MSTNIQLPVGHYWATEPTEDIAAIVRKKFDRFTDALEQCGDLPVMRVAGRQYYGEDKEGVKTWQVESLGSAGQARSMDANHFRANLTTAIAIATSDPPGLLPVPQNTDHAAQQLAEMAKGLLTYYQRSHGHQVGADAVLLEAVEIGEVYGWSWVAVEWDAFAGQVAQRLPMLDDAGAVVGQLEDMEGDIRCTALLPTDVAFDVDSRSRTPAPWLILRRWRNKFELASELEREAQRSGPDAQRLLEAAARVREMTPRDNDRLEQYTQAGRSALGFSDDIDTYELRYLPTPAVPQGRCVLVAGDSFLLWDRPHLYGRDDFGLYLYRSTTRIGSQRGYARTWDALGLQEGINGLGRIIYSNQYTLGQNVVVALEGSGVRAEQLSEGLKVLFVNRPDALKPMSFVSTPSEIPEFRKTLISESGRILGLDALSMGTETRDLSGAAMALLDTRTQRSLGPMASSANELRRKIGMGIIARAAEHPGMRTLPLAVGKVVRSQMVEVDFGQLAQIAAVELETVSPVMKSPAGRVEVATQLLGARGPDGRPALDAQQFVAVVNTGKYEPLTEGPVSQLQLIRAENEAMMAGKPVQALITDDHILHGQEHDVVLASPEARSNPELVRIVLAHRQQHITLAQPPPMPPGAAPTGGQAPTNLPPPGAAPESAPQGPAMPTVPTTGEQYSPTGALPNA